MIKHSMKKLFLLCMCLLGLYGTMFPQAPTGTPVPSPTAATAVAAATAATSLAVPAAATAAPSATSSSASSDLADRIHRKLEKKLGHKHGIVIDADSDHGESKDIPGEIIPLVGIVFLSIFGAPVLIVILIGMFALLVSRSRQRTIRMLVEKGQPVPAELLAPSTRAVRQRSDARRGVVWTMVGIGLMVWLGAVNDWEGGAWSFGLIPFLIGLGYLIIWKLENKKDIPPPPPAP
jgi:hypothetical protein